MKDFYSYEQQIEKLKEKGLIIHDEEFALSFLKSEGYYNVINGYSPDFKKNGDFYQGTTFDDICNLYAFDKELRSIIYKYTSSIETHIKALIAHEFSRVHGVDEKTYLQPECFSEKARAVEDVARLIETCNETIQDALNEKSNKYRKYIDHNYKNHHHVPLWILVRALSFGTISIFYKNMKEEEKEEIAKNYNIKASQLANMLEVVVSYRNIVAHGERTFCARLPKTRLSTKLSVTKKLSIEKNEKGDIKFGRNDFLALLICCKYLLPENEFGLLVFDLKNCIYQLSLKLNPVLLAHIKTSMGLKSNSWKNLPSLTIDDFPD